MAKQRKPSIKQVPPPPSMAMELQVKNAEASRSQNYFAEGTWRPAAPSIMLGEKDFADLSNFRYGAGFLEGIKGVSKINTTALSSYPKVRSSMQLVSPYTGSIVLTQAYNSGLTASQVLINTTAIPNQGDFSATALHTDASGAGRGRFALWPNDHIAYCNGRESMIYAGDEVPVGAFINYDPAGSFSYDYTTRVRDSLDDADSVAVMSHAAAGLDSNVMSLLHFENNVIDSKLTSPPTWTNTGVTFSSAVKVFGSYSSVFNGSSAFLNTADAAGFDMSAGVFTIDTWVRVDSLAAESPIYYQSNGSGDYFYLCITTDGRIKLVLHEGSPGSDVLTIQSAAGVIAINTWYWIELVENGNSWLLYVGTVGGTASVVATASDAARAKNYDSDIYIGRDGSSGTKYFDGYMDEFRLSNSARHEDSYHDVPAAAYSSATTTAYFYVATTRPIKGAKPYIKTANASAATMTWDYWTGKAFAACTNLVDGTSVGGKTLAQTGTVTFDDTKSVAKVRYLENTVLYFYRMTITGADAGTSIYMFTVNPGFQEVRDIWAGVEMVTGYCGKYDGTKFVDYTNDINDSSTTTYADLSALTSSQYMILGYPVPMLAFRFSMVAGSVNANSGTSIIVYSWTGSGWVLADYTSDGTANGTVSLSQTGTVFFQSKLTSDEQTRDQAGSEKMYYYKIMFGSTLSAAVKIAEITAIPAPGTIKGYKFPFMYRNRPMLCCSELTNELNRVDYGMTNTTDVFNGADSSLGVDCAPLYFGAAGALTGAVEVYNRVGSTLYQIGVFFKNNETYILTGTDSEDFQVLKVSGLIGCPSPQSIDTIEIGYGQNPDSFRCLAFWISYESPMMYDMATITPIEGFECYFDRYDADNAVDLSKMEDVVGWVDLQHFEYNFRLPLKAGGYIHLAWDIRKKRPIKKTPNIDATYNHVMAVCRARDTYGTPYDYGFYDNGYMRRLEYGDSWDGGAMTGAIMTGDFLAAKDLWIEANMEHLKLVALPTTAAESITVNHYLDGESVTSTALTAVSLQATNKEYVKNTQEVNIIGLTHCLEFGIIFAGDPTQVRLIGWAGMYTPERLDT